MGTGDISLKDPPCQRWTPILGMSRYPGGPVVSGVSQMCTGGGYWPCSACASIELAA